MPRVENVYMTGGREKGFAVVVNREGRRLKGGMSTRRIFFFIFMFVWHVTTGRGGRGGDQKTENV